ncbi:hypothetical protein Bbelb_277850 [Branchiostoma belcheri]|nr:hypothetical protein Bbelb_277850 [Branchiostoma belcheri]
MLPQPYTIRRTTRSSLSTGKHALTVPVSRTYATARTFIHTAVDIWNSLPDNVVGRITDNKLQSFKTRVHRHLLSTARTSASDGDIEVDNVYKDLDKNFHQYANQDEIDEELRQTGTRRKEQTNIGKNNTRPGNVRWFCNLMFVSGCSGQDENNDSTDSDTSAIPKDTSRRSYRLQWAIAVMLATVIGVGVGLVTYYTTVQERHPFSHNSPPVRWGTSSRPVSIVPVTSISSTMENRNDTITDLLLLQVGARTTSQYLKTMPKVETTLFRVTTTLPNGTTTPADVTTTSPEVTTTLPEVTTTLPEVTTTLPEVTTTLPEVTTTLSEVTTTLSEVTNTLPELTTTLPKVTTTLPKVTTTLPKVATTLPKVATTLPKMTTTPPEVFPNNVKRTRFDQIQKNTEPQPLTIQEAGDRYHSLGCWKDHSSRAIPTLEGLDSRLEGSYRTRSNAVEKCYQAAKSRSFAVFAVQHGGQCYGSADGHNTYFKYGRSTACQAGDGGTWANDVYRITTRTAAFRGLVQAT